MKNRKKVNEGLRNIAQNFEEQKRLDHSLQTELAKEYNELKNELKVKPGEKPQKK